MRSGTTARWLVEQPRNRSLELSFRDMAQSRVAKAELERAIADDPDDPAAYSVLADLLQQEGDPRGELIALQLRAETLTNRRRTLESTIKRYIKKHADVLVGALANEGSFVWRRGYIYRAAFQDPDVNALVQLFDHPSGRFLAELDIQCSEQTNRERKLDAAIDAVIAAGCSTLRALRLAGLGPDVTSLAKLWPAVPKLRELELEGDRFILGTVVLPSVEHVAVRTQSLSTDMAHAVAVSPWPVLRSLELWLSCSSPDRDAILAETRALLARDDLGQLTRLELVWALFSDEICRAIVASPLAGKLRELVLRLGTLTSVGAHVLVHGARALPELECLDVTENHQLGGDAIDALERAFPIVDS